MTRNTYGNTSDSVNLADHLHAGFKPCLWSGLAIRKPAESMSIEHDCVVNLRRVRTEQKAMMKRKKELFAEAIRKKQLGLRVR